MHVLRTSPPPAPTIVYPESDGKPMADNSKQMDWIVLIFENLRLQFRGLADRFVGGNLNWYPVEGHNEVVTAPDVFVVFGRPPGDRGSYRQWEEDDVPMTVVFEILSPGNSGVEMTKKFAFYEDHGVEEYYIYDPDSNMLQVWLRQGDMLRRVRPAADFVSPRLGIRFDLSGETMAVRHPDGRAFLTLEELEQLRLDAEARADAEKTRADNAVARLRRVAELARKVRLQQATPEEIAELERLEGEIP